MNKEQELKWLKDRQKGIGGSDIAPIFGKSSYHDAYDIYLSKTQEITKVSQGTGLTRLGKTLEPSILAEYERLKETKLSMTETMYHHPQNQFMMATLDGFDTQNKTIVEAKMSLYNKDQWLKNGEYAIPTQYLLQVAHYCYVTNSPKADVIVYFVNCQQYAIITYHRDAKLEKVILDGCTAFWHNHVLKRVPPRATDKSFQTALNHLDLMKLVEEKHEASKDVMEMIDLCSLLQKEISEKESLLKSYKANIMEYCKEHNAKKLIHPATGRVITNLIGYKGRTSLDNKGLKEAHPKIYEEFLKEGAAYNVLKINNGE